MGEEYLFAEREERGERGLPVNTSVLSLSILLLLMLRLTTDSRPLKAPTLILERRLSERSSSLRAVWLLNWSLPRLLREFLKWWDEGERWEMRGGRSSSVLTWRSWYWPVVCNSWGWTRVWLSGCQRDPGAQYQDWESGEHGWVSLLKQQQWDYLISTGEESKIVSRIRCYIDWR